MYIFITLTTFRKYISHWPCSNYLYLCFSMWFIKWRTKKLLLIGNSCSTPYWKLFKNKFKHYLSLFKHFFKLNIRVKHVHYFKLIIRICSTKNYNFSYWQTGFMLGQSWSSAKNPWTLLLTNKFYQSKLIKWMLDISYI